MHGGDFDWTIEAFHNNFTLQRSPTFIDCNQANERNLDGATRENTMPCALGVNLLCSREWYRELNEQGDLGGLDSFKYLSPWLEPEQVGWDWSGRVTWLG